MRHGHLPEREIMTGIGPVAVRAPRVRDRTGQGADRIRFSSALLPPYARRSKSLEVLIPALYLKGISTGDFAEALAALLGPDAGGLSASTVARLTEVWADQHAHWLKRDLSARHYVYFWADGIHVQARLEDDAQCLLVIIGATPEGKKELVGLIDGVRESAQSWRELLLDLKRRGLAVAPDLAIADGALGFWKAIEEVWPRTRSQRCWVHKTANVLNKLPKSQHSKAKACSPGNLDGRDQERRRQRLRRLHRDLCRQVRQGGRMPGQGSRRRCWHSTTFPPSIGSICAPPTPSKAHSPPCDTVPCDPRDASPTRRRSPWSSNSPRRHRTVGAASTDTTSCPS